MRFTFPASLLLLGATLPLVAQTHYCIAGDLDHLTQTEVTACRAKMTHVRDAVKRRGAPSGWHFVVVCDETGWSDYASFTGKAGARLLKAEFDTDRNGHWTFLRGSRIADDDGQTAGAALSIALYGVPGIHPEPGVEAAPQLMPNPERTLQIPALQVAEAHMPDESVTGQ